jgi:hypothetical protein
MRYPIINHCQSEPEVPEPHIIIPKSLSYVILGLLKETICTSLLYNYPADKNNQRDRQLLDNSSARGAVFI